MPPPATVRRAGRFPFLRGLHRRRLRFGKLRGQPQAGTRPSFATGAGLDFREFRRYTPGDDTRHLDWNAFGRLEQLYLKQFEAFADLTLDVVLDRTPSMDFGGRGEGTPGHKLTFARGLVAALGYVALNSLDRVRLLTLPWLAGQVFPASQGRERIPAWLDQAARLRAEPLARHTGSLRDVLADRRHQHMVVLVSDFQEPQVWFDFLDFLRKHVAATYVLHLVAPQERTVALEPGEASLTDVELPGQARLELTPAVLRAYREELARHLHRVETWCAHKRVGYLQLDTGAPLAAPVWQALCRAGLWE